MNMRRTKSQVRAEQIARLQKEQEAYERNIRESVKSAAFARCAAVEELYEMLGVAPERPKTREGRSGLVLVSSDKDETKRAGRLVEAVARLAAEPDGLVVPEQQRTRTSSPADSLAIPHGHPMGLPLTG
ncbi:hypothetical protein [Plantibacter sp. M259]|nr:hypothetical protein [Plantibacter sp. M259]